MLVDIQTYLNIIFTNAEKDKNLITIDHQPGLIKYIFSKEYIDIKAIPDQLQYHLHSHSGRKEYIMLMNKVLGDKININDVVFDNAKKITIIGNRRSKHCLTRSPIKIKDLLLAIHQIIHMNDTFIGVTHIHEVPYTNELIISIDHGDIR
tara:strand:- start:4660 stop:5109 length:450 start_codon:yes stop_codon:yes gene_type:complete